MGAVQVRVTDAPGEDVFGVLLRLEAVEAHLTGGEGWVTLVEGPIEIDLIGISGIEQIVGESLLPSGRYTQMRLQVTDAEVTLAAGTKSARIPSGELKLVGSFEIEQGNTTVITIDFDAAASVIVTGNGDVILRPVARLMAGQPTAVTPPIELPSVSLTGLLAMVPSSAALDLREAFEVIDLVHPGRSPRTIQVLLLLPEDDQPYLVVALDAVIDHAITAGTVSGRRVPPLAVLPEGLEFVKRVLVSDDVTLMEPVPVTPSELNQFPDEYAFKRVAMDATYVFSGARIIDASPGAHRFGFGVATGRFGALSADDYVTVVDLHSTETQIRVAQLTGTVLAPTAGVRLLLGQLLGFASEDVEQALDGPSVFYEALIDDEAELRSIGELVATTGDPASKLPTFHGEMVSVQGLALGGMVRTEDLPQLGGLPLGVTLKSIGVVDATGAMPIISISSEDVDGDVFGYYRFDLSVYAFDEEAAFAFLIGKEPVPLDTVAEVDGAGFGDRVAGSLAGYLVTELEQVDVSAGLVLGEIEVLVPTSLGDPLILTRHPDLAAGDYLSEVSFDGFLIDGRLLGLPDGLLTQHGPGVIIVNAGELTYESGVLSTPTPTATPSPTPTLTPTARPTATPPTVGY